MDQKALLKTLAFALLLATFIHPCLVHPRNLETAPSPAPESGVQIGHHDPKPSKGRNDGKTMRGSFPAKCHSKCNQCRPCMPVEVSVRAMALENNEYYPQVWKCMCRDNLFSP
ncbi:EPIDERMAL PATTERNING FACTOR-like protein 4 [Morella rubra]|uniref:Epidermal patterning factor-like protein n=1 Tax=Morella rubra TaxID=262757 RepID=A0A6A1V6A3_9ROSI|nr:EPIDERMAL PATTERNING FACTOR-like protein 4 [Morella rubra]